MQQTGVTGELARFVVESRWSSIPGAINHEARRALLNWAGCALGGCRDEAVEWCSLGMRMKTLGLNQTLVSPACSKS